MLNKGVYNLFRSKNAYYKHKFYVLFHSIFDFLAMLPANNIIDYSQDIYFYELMERSSIQKAFRNSFTKDVYFIYGLVRSEMLLSIYKVCIHLADFSYVKTMFIRSILSKGPEYIIENCKFYFNKNKVKCVMNDDFGEYIKNKYFMIDNN